MNTGQSIHDAIIITDAKDHFDGIEKEYLHLTKLFGIRGKDWVLMGQSLLSEQGRIYDAMEIQKNDGTELTIYFDITKFYGKGFNQD